MADAGYVITRRQGIRVTLVQVTSSGVNPQTGERTGTRVSKLLHKVVKEPTSYAHRVSAREAQEEVGPTTFLFYTRDIPSIKKLNTVDYILVGDVKFQVVTSTLEDTILRITARELTGQSAIPPTVTVTTSQAIGLNTQAETEVET